ncbi:DUF2969 domain-containing protein [Loigolactobacillus rennini]|uniref:DUF2969 domain-containing protein n=1 Tax=Loigolactobacillus rennini DSM 20253 TaxID=1423796 RepID=A0A0R2D3V4_9LACO|nr:DUF2969 domain-containing protein [Loigolactobacillus rennini]KRM98583.1 hypothetical protein FC24_GL001177 [Loigolactobacillus rennini DSM 20253]
MAKQPNKIKLNIEEEKQAGATVNVVYDGKRQIGSIQEADAQFIVKLTNGATYHTKSYDEGLNELIMQYHLHK